MRFKRYVMSPVAALILTTGALFAATTPAAAAAVITSPWLFAGQSYMQQGYGCTTVSLEPVPPDSRCSGSPYGPYWHTGVDIAGGTVGCGTVFYVGQTLTVTTVYIQPSFSVIEARLADSNYLVIYHAQAAYVSVGYTYTLGAKLGAVGNYGNSTGCHIHFEIDGPNHTVGHFQDWTDIDPMAELSGADTAGTATGDFHGDGYADLAAMYNYGGTTTGLFVWKGSASGLQAPTRVWESTTFDWRAIKVTAGDFNGDGYSDLAAAYRYGALDTGLWVWNGSPTGLQSPRLVWRGTSFSWNASILTTGNFYGGRYGDLAILYNYGGSTTGLWVWKGSASGLQSPILAWKSTGFRWDASKVTAGDFYGLGYADLAVLYNYTGTTTGLFVWRGSDTGLQSPTLVWKSTTFDWMQSKLIAGDFNGRIGPRTSNRIFDLAVLYHYGTHNTGLWVWQGSAAGFLAPQLVWRSTTFDWIHTKLAAGDYSGTNADDFATLYSYLGAKTGLWDWAGAAFGLQSPVLQWLSTGFVWDAAKLG